jgi:hypothetical protein
MQGKRPLFLVLLIGTLAAVSLGVIPSPRAATPEDLNQEADQALHRLTSTNPLAAALAKKAKAVLIFPNIVKAGLIFGGAYGEGVLKQYPSLRPRTGDSAGGFLTYSAASSSAEVDPLSGVSAWGYSAQAYGAEGKGRDRRENPWGILFSARKKRAYDRPRTPRSPRAILGGSVPCVHRCADF